MNDSTIYLAVGTMIAAYTVLAANGTVLWHSQGQPQRSGAFLFVGAMLYCQDASGITAYRLVDSRWRWHFATTLPMGVTLLASGDTLYADRGAAPFALMVDNNGAMKEPRRSWPSSWQHGHSRGRADISVCL